MNELQMMPTGIPNLDTILGGGIPAYSLNIIAGKPGTGKTIMAQQILFNYVHHHPEGRALYLTTLSEPTIKVLRYMKHFTFFDSDVFDERLLYRDLGRFIRDHPLATLVEYIMSLVTTHRPDLVVIDSFKVIRDLPEDTNTFRQFCYDLAVQLATARCTTFFLGEYTMENIGDGAEFAVADGIFYLFRALQQGEQQRFLQIDKLRGQAAQMSPFPFVISSSGMLMLAPNLMLKDSAMHTDHEETRLATGISGMDDLLHGGIPRGHSVILSGVSGTGKTTCAMQFLVHGARQSERGLFFSFEEPPQRLRRMARGFGWDLRTMEEQGLIRVNYISQNDIRMEELFAMIMQEMENFQPQRFVMDSFSVFLYRVNDPAIQRERASQLKTLIRQYDAVGVLISDIPAGLTHHQLSRFGVEETVADGTIVLSTDMQGRQRRRYVEIYKMRATDHVPGQHRIEITGHGIEVMYLAPRKVDDETIPAQLNFTPLPTIFRGDVRYGSTWLIQGEEGAGKSSLAYQFAAEGLTRQEGVLLIATDMSTYQVQRDMQSWGIPVDEALRSGHLQILDTHPILGKDYVSLSDMERFLYDIARHLNMMPTPCRLIVDSITPLAIQYAPQEFVAFIEQKNRLLRQSNLVLMDIVLPQTLDDNISYSLRNNYDAVLDVCFPRRHETNSHGDLLRLLRVNKARGMSVKTKQCFYIIQPGEGLIMQENHYETERELP